MADPSRSDEIVMSAGAAAEQGLRVGSALRLAFFTTAQVNSSSFAGYPADKPYLAITLRLVGIIEFDAQVVQDDDAALGDQLAVITPALTRRLESCCAYYSYVSLERMAGRGTRRRCCRPSRRSRRPWGRPCGSQTSAPLVAKAERTIRPEAVAFGVFGLITALAALVISGQVISRLVRRDAADGAILRALGAGPAMTLICDGLVGVIGAAVTGALLAVAVAVLLSPLAPIGPVRPVYPDRGVALDWTVLGVGFAVLVIMLSGSAVAVALRVSPHRASRARADIRRGSRLAQAAAAGGLPPAAVTGIRSALGPSSGREAAPVRSALLGSVIAVMVVTASITFGSSLSFLVSHPPLYGWGWDYALLSGFSAAENLPAAETATLLDHDRVVAHWAGVYFEHMSLDGQAVPALATEPERAGQPAAAVRARPAGGVTGGPRAEHPGPAAQARRRYGHRQHRARTAIAPAHRGHSHVAHHRELGGPIAADGHRRDRRRRPLPRPGPQPARNPRARPDGRVDHDTARCDPSRGAALT